MKLAVALLLGLAVPGGAEPLPRDGPDAHGGVAACASPLCHNAVTPWQGTSIRSNEYRIWRERDHHARAFVSLEGPLGGRIGRALGIVPTAAAECLGCHTDAVPAERCGRGYAVRDGVGCEACHGGAARWLATHPTAARADAVAQGMYPTDEPRARAELCLSCHLGGEGRLVTHRMLAAGHPRLAFELDTFGELEPPHWAPREAHGKAKTWAIGQAVALREYLGLVARAPAAGAGWYELALFDCAACHHDLGKRAAATSESPDGIGLPALSGAPFALYRTVLALVAPAEAGPVDAGIASLARAIAARSRDVPARAQELRRRVATSVDVVAAARLDDARLLAALAGCDRPTDRTTYLVAEQLAMAVQATVADRHGERALAKDADVAELLAATDGLRTFDPTRFQRALRAFCARP